MKGNSPSPRKLCIGLLLLVTVFPFGDNVDPREDRGASDDLVNVETLSVVIDAWNSHKQVNVLLVKANK